MQARRGVHGAADYRVVHPVLAAEVADGAVVGVDADAAAQRCFNSNVAPDVGKFVHPLLHGESHLHTGERVLLDTASLRIAEKHQDRVADVFVDRRAVIQSNFRHFRQVVIEELSEILGLHLVSGLGKAGDVRKEDRQLLAAAGNLDLLLAAENRTHRAEGKDISLAG